MNNIHPILREALAPFAPVDADRIKVGHALLESANEPSVTHRITRERDGFGPAGSVTLVCSCGWLSRPQYEWQDDMSAQLLAQERAHLQGAL